MVNVAIDGHCWRLPAERPLLLGWVNVDAGALGWAGQVFADLINRRRPGRWRQAHGGVPPGASSLHHAPRTPSDAHHPRIYGHRALSHQRALISACDSPEQAGGLDPPRWWASASRPRFGLDSNRPGQVLVPDGARGWLWLPLTVIT